MAESVIKKGVVPFSDLPQINSFDMTMNSLVDKRLCWYYFFNTIQENPIPNSGILMVFRVGTIIFQRIFGIGGEMKSRVFFNNTWSSWN